MTSLNYVTPQLQAAEEEIRQRWGDLRGKAIIFARGTTFEEALERNEDVYSRLAGSLAPAELVSLAPVFPAAKTREARSQDWLSFWGGKDGRRTLELLREGARLGFSPRRSRPLSKRPRARGPRPTPMPCAKPVSEGSSMRFCCPQRATSAC
jgi:hypothetical protein